MLTSKIKRLQKNVFTIFWDQFFWFYTFMVGHSIIYQRIIIENRYPEFNWQIVLNIFFAAIPFTVLGLLIPKCSLGKALTGLYLKSVKEENWTKRPYVWFALFLTFLTFVASIYMSQFSLSEFLSPAGIEGARRIFVALLTPNFAIFEEALFAAIETIYMAFLATAAAIPVAFILSFFAARNLMIHSRFFMGVYTVLRLILNITRSIEPLVWAIIFSVWVGIGPFAGMLALWLHSIASLIKLYSEQVESINDGPLEAMTAVGSHPIQVVWFGVVPQVVIPFLSYTIYRWDINVRMATVIGLVGGGGIGTLLMQYQGLAKWHEVGLLVIFIAAIVWAMDYASAKIREVIK